MLAPGNGVTGIIGATIGIGTILGFPGTLATHTNLVNGAEVIVVADTAIVGRHHVAHARTRIALGLGTGGVFAAGQ